MTVYTDLVESNAQAKPLQRCQNSGHATGLRLIVSQDATGINPVRRVA